MFDSLSKRCDPKVVSAILEATLHEAERRSEADADANYASLVKVLAMSMHLRRATRIQESRLG